MIFRRMPLPARLLCGVVCCCAIGVARGEDPPTPSGSVPNPSTATGTGGQTVVATSQPQTSATGSTGPTGGTSGVQFEDDFSSVDGGTQTWVNGQATDRDGQLSLMASTFAFVPPGQPTPLRQLIGVDNTITGPDGQPGVLRLQYLQVPRAVESSGFRLSGSTEAGHLTLSGGSPERLTLDDLGQTYIEFKFRADNPQDPNDFGGLFEFRIEPDSSDPYGRRADFGVLVATRRWRTFRRPIGTANNLDWFLLTVNDELPAPYHLIWSQHGPGSSMSPGDSLLIDDLKIVIE